MTAKTIDSSLRYFGALCDQICSDSSLTVKQEILSGFIARYNGNMGLLFKLLLPKFNGRLYHLQDKQLIKLFALALKVTEKTIRDDVNMTGCIAMTVQKLFHPRPSATIDASTGWCTLKMEDLDAHLEALSKVTQEDAQLAAIQAFLNVACKKALFLYLRQIKQDLKLGAGIRCVLSGLHPSANAVYKQCANIQEVVRRVLAGETDVADEDDDDAASPGRVRSPSPPAGRAALKKGAVVASITLGMPMAPMLAAPSKGIDHVLSKCPNGAFSETKYDGERIQIHKSGQKFTFYARSLKPMKEDKYEGLDVFLAKAVQADSIILDGEILLVDIATSQPLPFGTLGKHKKAQFLSACTCIVLFDIMYVNGTSLLNVPLEKRREIMKSAVHCIPNRVVLSEMRHVSGTIEQRKHIMQRHLAHAIAEGLEGLVVKDVQSVYEPAARHWVKLKKDYLEGMADSADLVVLGAYYGSGAKGGLLSTFLMGVCDKTVPVGGRGRWKTVCKVGNGHDDATLTALNEKYKTFMVSPSAAPPKAPLWIDVHNSHMPDKFVSDPEASDVWEIIGAEFSTTKTHTAASISLRFPRVLKRRDDKDPSIATSLQELVKLVEVSKEKSTRLGLAAEIPNDDEDDELNGSDRAPVLLATRVATKDVVAHRPLDVVLKEVLGGAVAHGVAAAVVPPAAVAAPRFARTHADDEEYRARLHSAVVPAAAPAAAAHPATTAAPKPSLEYVTSEIAQPLSSADNPHQNMVILHSTALKGKWSNRGTMGSITKYLGEEPQDAYAELSPTIKIGEVIFCEVSNRQSSGKLYVGTMIGQQAAAKAGEVPQVDPAALKQCIEKGFAFAKKFSASVHVAKLDRVTGVDWTAVDSLLKHLTAEHGVRCVVYSRDGGTAALARSKTYAPVASPAHPPPSLESTHGFTRLGTSVPNGSSPPALGPSESALLVTRTESDLGGAFMDGVTCWLSPAFAPRDSAALQQKLTMMGGRVATAHAACTHVVLASSSDPNAPPPAATQSRVLRGWLDDSFVHGRKLDENAYSAAAHASAPAQSADDQQRLAQRSSTGSIVFNALRSAKVVIDGFAEKERDELSTKVCMLGGVVQERWKTVGSTKSTHMVSRSWSAEAQRVSDLGGVIVSRAWIDAAMAAGVAPDPMLYMMSSSSAGVAAASVSIAAGEVRVVQARREEARSSSPGSALPPTLREDSFADSPAPSTPPPVTRRSPTSERSPSPVAKPMSPRGVPSACKRPREATPPRRIFIDTLPPTPAAQICRSRPLAGLTFACEGYSSDVRDRLERLVAYLGGVVVPAFRVGCSYLICETLTLVSLPLVRQSKVVTSAWICDMMNDSSHAFKDPSVNAARYLYGHCMNSARTGAPLLAAEARSTVTQSNNKSVRERDEGNTTDEDDAPPPKSSRCERLLAASSLPPTVLPATVLLDTVDDGIERLSPASTETASTVPDGEARDVDSPASTVSDDTVLPAARGGATAAPVLLPSLFGHIVALVVPVAAEDRDAEMKSSINESRRFLIAYGADVISSIAEWPHELPDVASRIQKGGCSVVLLLPTCSVLSSAARHRLVQQAITALQDFQSTHPSVKVITTAGVVDKNWVMECLRTGSVRPYIRAADV